tara:strand:+ start:2251 stop:2520 length:270 start_codon:yes stop_codon:yes gene_type:complete
MAKVNKLFEQRCLNEDSTEDMVNTEDDQPTIEDGVNPITGYDVDKVSPGMPKQKPRSTNQYPTTYSSSQIEKSRSDISNYRDIGESVNK